MSGALERQPGTVLPGDVLCPRCPSEDDGLAIPVPFFTEPGPLAAHLVERHHVGGMRALTDARAERDLLATERDRLADARLQIAGLETQLREMTADRDELIEIGDGLRKQLERRPRKKGKR